MEETHVYRSKTKLLLLLICSAGIIFLLAWLLTLPFSGEDVPRKAWVAIILAPLAIPVFGYAGIRIAMYLLSDEPFFTVNKDGLLDRRTMKKGVFIPWSEVQEVQLLKSRGGEMLIIKVNEPLKTYEKLSGFEKIPVSIARSLGDNHPTFSATTTTLSNQELYELFNKYFDAYKQQNRETETLPQ